MSISLVGIDGEKRRETHYYTTTVVVAVVVASGGRIILTGDHPSLSKRDLIHKYIYIYEGQYL